LFFIKIYSFKETYLGCKLKRHELLCQAFMDKWWDSLYIKMLLQQFHALWHEDYYDFPLHIQDVSFLRFIRTI